jgi:hypothetical protein
MHEPYATGESIAGIKKSLPERALVLFCWHQSVASAGELCPLADHGASQHFLLFARGNPFAGGQVERRGNSAVE